jgi:hypothetical protein
MVRENDKVLSFEEIDELGMLLVVVVWSVRERNKWEWFSCCLLK